MSLVLSFLLLLPRVALVAIEIARSSAALPMLLKEGPKAMYGDGKGVSGSLVAGS